MENKMEEAAGRIGDGVGLVNVVFSSIKDVQSVASKGSGEGFEAFVATLGLFDFLELDINVTLLFLDENVLYGAKGLA